MALDVRPPSADRFRLHPVEPRHAAIFCFALLTLSCALASFALACATPFAAFAVIAAAALPRRPALLVVAGAWLVNQTIGFGALHYPINFSTIAWGFVIGAAALAATAASASGSPRLATEACAADARSRPDLRILRLRTRAACGHAVSRRGRRLHPHHRRAARTVERGLADRACRRMRNRPAAQSVPSPGSRGSLKGCNRFDLACRTSRLPCQRADFTERGDSGTLKIL